MEESVSYEEDDEIEDPEVFESNSDVGCEGKPDTGNRKLQARFGRRRTHNDELCVTSCGVILGRATFYGSEAQSGVIVSARRACSHF